MVSSAYSKSVSQRLRFQIESLLTSLLMPLLFLSLSMADAAAELPPAKIGSTAYTSILSAYLHAEDGDIIQCTAAEYPEGLLLNNGTAVTIKGGYDPGFASNSSGQTTINGMVEVVSGSVVVDNLIITGVSVPNTVSMTLADAQSSILNSNLTVGPIYSQYSAAVPGGSIIAQYPDQNSTASPGAEVALIVSAGLLPNYPLVPITYSLVRDSDGAAPISGSQVFIAFEPLGTALLLVATDTDGLSYQGTYTFSNNTLHLTFSDPDFIRDTTFTLDPASKTVAMPFKVFSDGAGTSLWNRQELPLAQNLSMIFQGATYALWPYLPTEQAIDRVVAYLGAYGAVPAAGFNVNQANTNLVSAMSLGSWFGPNLVSVGRSRNGVTLMYDQGPPEEVVLFSSVAGDGASLTPSYLASDPRVNLNVVNPNNPADDPDEKTALFVAPFYSLIASDWYDYYFANGLASPANVGYVAPVSKDFPFSAMGSDLEDKGYTVQMLLDDKVTVPQLVKALTPGHGGRMRSPAFVVINTHGVKSGGLATGEPLSQRFAKYLLYKRLEELALTYPDLPTYNGGTTLDAKTLGIMWIHQVGDPKKLFPFVMLRPDFWNWLRDRQSADFHKSLVYMAACETDATSSLRDAVQAKAYFAYSEESWPAQSISVFKYLVKSLSRHTHTPEEAFYNIIRVFNTGQMIYAEDQLLNGHAMPSGVSGGPLSETLNGYGYDVSQSVPEVFSYRNGGWLKSAGSPGNVWWLLFAGRWGQNAQDGATALENCWNLYWSKGSTGGLANPWCNNAAPGGVPQDIEVAYATYLLTGTPLVRTDIFKQPRFTLHDGP